MNICFVFFCDKRYEVGLNKLLKSLEKYNFDKILLSNDIKNNSFDKIIKYENLESKCHIDKLKSVFSKIEIFNIKNYDRIIYFDSDMLCIGDISYLFSEELNMYDICGVKGKDGRLNAGMMVINKSIFDFNPFDECMKIYNKYKILYLADQTIINIFLKNEKIKIGYLSDEYNFSDKEVVENNWKSSRIIHFIKNKPWISPKGEIGNYWLNYG